MLMVETVFVSPKTDPLLYLTTVYSGYHVFLPQGSPVSGRFGFSWPSPAGWTDFRPFHMFRSGARRATRYPGRHAHGGSDSPSPLCQCLTLLRYREINACVVISHPTVILPFRNVIKARRIELPQSADLRAGLCEVSCLHLHTSDAPST